MKITLLTAILFFTQISLARIELYGGMNIGSSKMDESLGGSSYSHSNSFFVGHWGFGGGSRFKLDFEKLGIGGVVDLVWLGDTFERKQSNGVSDATYRLETYRVLAGANLSLAFGPLALIAEYYPYGQNTITYSDDKSENPYRKNDKLKCTGYGVGFNFDFGSGFGYSTIFRRLTYKDVEMNGSSVTLPSSQYSALNIDEVFVSLLKTF